MLVEPQVQLMEENLRTKVDTVVSKMEMKTFPSAENQNTNPASAVISYSEDSMDELMDIKKLSKNNEKCFSITATNGVFFLIFSITRDSQNGA